MEQKFDWSATLSAPKEYPVQVYRGEITAKDYTQSLSGFGDINYGWGEEGGTVVMGPDLKSIPDSLEIAWHSFVDQKNFEGKWALPKEELIKLFNEGIVNKVTNKKITYNKFVVGLAPNGLVVIWLSSVRGQVEIAHYKAKEVSVNVETISEENKPIFSKKYNDVVLSELNNEYNTFERIKKKEYPKTDLYEGYRLRYLWKPLIELSDNEMLINFVMHTYNGEIEIESSNKKEQLNVSYKERGVLKYLAFGWIDKEQKKEVGCWLEEFNENELFNAYKKFNPTEEINFIIKVINKSKVSIKLKSMSQEIEIKKFKLTIE
ncbi:DUF2931 family protein [Flavobacterium sp. J27]|uniref:DUF2931 family protein n=1 Tax=Flavobacterium sp. J27 TaxID=2060419 RepID=UPI001F0DC1A9|nr:DUF2931 family protein [Flavobacterium sp. J27]